MKGALAMAAFALLDPLIWVVVRPLPGPREIRLSRQRPWRRLALRLSPQRQQWCYARIRSLLSRRCRQDPLASTCLSRSLAGRLLLDLIGVPNELHLGMSLFEDGLRLGDRHEVEVGKTAARPIRRRQLRHGPAPSGGGRSANQHSLQPTPPPKGGGGGAKRRNGLGRRL